MIEIGMRKQRLFFFLCFCLFCVDETTFLFVSATAVTSATTLIAMATSRSTATAAATAIGTETIMTNSSIVKKSYNFAMVPKNINNPFFEIAHKGCADKARTISTTTMSENNSNNSEFLNISCIYVGPEGDDAEEQAAIIDELISAGDIDGIAVAVSSLSETTLELCWNN
mmetsp:Transcript_64639/g.72400  ORF Transcript_64639/g.72400 Transcript_64639/m.72400 type:complete len:170 (+) Transcript_64639:145-654(+)